MKAEYINHMGDDLTIVNSARVSFDKQSDWLLFPAHEVCEEYDDPHAWVERLGEKDTKLIKYLAKHGHWTPFSHCSITVRETVPIFIARQRFKHMIGFTYSEVSRRYVDDPPEFYFPDEWRKRAENKKQGSADEAIEEEWGELYSSEYRELIRHAETTYKRMLNVGICPEQARMVLPQSMYTSYYVTGSLAAWARAYKLRIDSHAQKEIQDLAKQWDEIIKPLFPVSWNALKEN